MTPLPHSFNKNGFCYEQVCRHGDIVIYQQRLRPGVGCLAFEVFYVKKAKECVMFGKKVEAHEAVPGNEEWGNSGWTLPTLERARAKMRELERAGEKKRNK